MNSVLHKNNVAAHRVLRTKPLKLQSKAKPFVQAKLKVNEPGDLYEQEADAMADRVMRMQSNETVKPVTGLIGKSLQRKCAHCEEEEKKKKPIMRKAEAGNSDMSVSSSFASSLNASKGSGSSLPQGTRSFMENAFSTDFSSVKIHTDSQASEMSKGISAKAFTTGNDIYFKSGEYSPNSENGKKLLAHELTHVVQQQDTIPVDIHRQEEEPSKKQIKRDDYLRRLSVWPDEAHLAWRSLNQGEQVVVGTYMTIRYGVDFASLFLSFTKLKKKPDPVAFYTNVLTETHQQLYARGFRLVIISLGIEHWVHPSGNSIHRILPSKESAALPAPTDAAKPKAAEEEKKTYEYGGVTYDKQSGRVKSYPKSMEARCMLPCLNNTTNEDDCEDCCLDNIPANDDGCINFCIASCQDYFD
jgi:hypothetical protein